MTGYLEFDTKELPDYLPAFLEYISTRPEEERDKLIGNIVDIIAILDRRLKEKLANYSAVTSALIMLTTKKVNNSVVEKALKFGKKKAKTLDDEWQEPIAFDKDNDCQANCKSAKQCNQNKETDTGS